MPGAQPSAGAEGDSLNGAVDKQSAPGDESETAQTSLAVMDDDPSAAGDDERTAGDTDERPERPAHRLEGRRQGQAQPEKPIDAVTQAARAAAIQALRAARA